MKGARIMDGTVPAGHEVTMGPGSLQATGLDPRTSLGRECAYPPCTRRLHPEDPPTKVYHHSKCRTAHWKLRKASQTASGVVAVRAFGPSLGDAQNASTGLSKRARELREARARGTVASDLRVQYARAVDVLAEYLRLLNIPRSEAKAHEVLSQALPKGRRG
jgi:hypothetical protein